MKSLLFYFWEVNVIRNKFNITFTWRCSDYTAWKFPQKQLMAEELVWLWNHWSVFRILHILGWYLCFIFHAAGCLSFSFQWILLSFFLCSKYFANHWKGPLMKPGDPVSMFLLCSCYQANEHDLQHPIDSLMFQPAISSVMFEQVAAKINKRTNQNK